MAGTTKGIRAGAAFVELGIKDGSLVKGLKDAATSLKSLGASTAIIGAEIAGLGTGITAPFLDAVKIFAQTGTELYNMSLRTGLSVEALSTLGHAATQTGTDLGAVEIATKRMQKNLVEAAEGSTEAEVAFNGLGLSIEYLAQLSPTQQFGAVAKGISRITNPTLKAGTALRIFGKSGTSIIPLIDNLGALVKETNDFNLAWSTDMAKRADRLGDAFRLLWDIGKKLASAIGDALAPAFSGLALMLANSGKTLIDWIQNNKDLLVTIFSVAAGVAAAGTAITALGAAVIFTGTAVSAMATIFSVVGAAIGVVGTAISLLMTPVGLVVIGLVELTVGILKFTGLGGQAMAYLAKVFGSFGETFGQFKTLALQTFSGIADALSAGDIELAGKILFAGLNVVFVKGLAELTSFWHSWTDGIVDLFFDTKTNIGGIFLDISGEIQKIWNSLISGLTGSWGAMISTLLSMLIPFKTTIEKIFGVDIEDEINKGLNAIGLSAGGKDARGRQEDLQRQNAGVDKGTADAKKILEVDNIHDQENRHKGNQSVIDEAMKAYQDAQKNFKDLRSKAATEAAGAAKPAELKKGQDLTPDGLDEALANTYSNKTEVKGSFNAAAVRGLGSGDSQNEALKEAKKQSEELIKLNRKAAQGRLIFTS